MTHNDNLYIFKKITNEQDDAISRYYLDSASNIILRKAYPYNPEITEVPSEYMSLLVDVAIFLYNKQGAEGETTHNENGINRSYENGSVPNSMLRMITPRVGVLK